MRARDQQVVKLKQQAMECYAVYRFVQDRLKKGMPVGGDMIRRAGPAKDQFNKLMDQLKKLDPQFPTARL